MNPLRFAATVAADYAYAAYWQVQGALFRVAPGHYALTGASAPPVVLLPGVYETWQFLRPVADRARQLGHPVHVVPALRRNTMTVTASADLVLDFLSAADLRDVVIVAHSKGGLIGKQAMLRDDDGRIARMVAIATPFAGSTLARYMLGPTLRAFSPADSTITMLGKQLVVNSRIVNVRPKVDPHIPRAGDLEGARNMQLAASGHFKIIGSAEVLDIVAAVLAETGPAGRSA